MCHIDIGKRSPRSGSGIIFVILLAIAGICCGSDRAGESDAPAVSGDTELGREGVVQPADGAGSPVQEYLVFAASADDKSIQGSGADYLTEGLRKLAGALGFLEVGGLDLTVDLRVAAEHVVLNPTSTVNTEIVRKALTSAADALDARRQGGDPALRRVAESIRPDLPLLDQVTTLQEFFRASATAIRPLTNKD